MKKKARIFIVGLIALLMAGGMIMAGCSGGGGGDSNSGGGSTTSGGGGGGTTSGGGGNNCPSNGNCYRISSGTVNCFSKSCVLSTYDGEVTKGSCTCNLGL